MLHHIFALDYSPDRDKKGVNKILLLDHNPNQTNCDEDGRTKQRRSIDIVRAQWDSIWF